MPWTEFTRYWRCVILLKNIINRLWWSRHSFLKLMFIYSRIKLKSIAASCVQFQRLMSNWKDWTDKFWNTSFSSLCFVGSSVRHFTFEEQHVPVFILIDRYRHVSIGKRDKENKRYRMCRIIYVYAVFASYK
jgi:hypothetical protein